MSIVSAIAKMAKPAAKVLMGAAVTAGVVSVFSSCNKEPVIEPNVDPFNPNLPHPSPDPCPIDPWTDIDPEILEKLKELLEKIQSIDAQTLLVTITGMAHELPEDYEAKFWAWFDENKPDDFETNPTSALAFTGKCLKKLQDLAVEANLTELLNQIQEIINGGITPVDPSIIQILQEILNEMNGGTASQMVGIVKRAMSLPEGKREEFFTWFNENKPASFGSNAMHTNSFINECKEKLDQLEGKVIRPKSSKKLNTEA